ncbi:MAG: winged helix-turn-helix domain-containing protein [Bifidobacteriaceae bacterium]|jgi:DNA-binding response OmpR family regulator|nr:winged helix-turn-helix domain-containing protein [Bifidobacteriaceae bacterium]
MTATAYAPAFPHRRQPSYRGPLIVIPGGRARARRVRQAEWSAPPEAAPPLAVSGESIAAARAFQQRLAALPVRSEIKLSRSSQSVRVDGSARRLTPREFDLLAALAAQPGEPVTRDALLAVGPGGRNLDESSRAVDVHVAHLREKLALPGVIATVRGRGYALNPAYRVIFQDAG